MMRTRSGFRPWRLAAGVSVMGLFALTLTLHGAPAPKKKESKAVKSGTPAVSDVGALHQQGTKVPGTEDDVVLLAPQGAIPVQSGKPAKRVADSGVSDAIGSVAGPAGTCRFSIDCDDCNPCTRDVCQLGTCLGGQNAGLGCFDTSDCPGGACSIGTCSVSGSPCVTDTDCPTGETCNLSTSFFGTCANFAVPDGGAGDCDDGLECNGQEFCQAGACVSGTPLCNPEDRCDEATDTCFASCLNDAECDDGLLCNGAEVCDVKTCEGGTDAGTPCRVNADCSSGVCGGGGTGACVTDPATADPCGPGSLCLEPTAPGDPVTCGEGRCCDPADPNPGTNCTRATFADCTGTWLAGSIGETCSGADLTDPTVQNCPNYSSGIAPQGDFTVSVGPVSVSPCDVVRIGDDYELDLGPNTFFRVTKLRFAGGVVPGVSARFGVEFRDANGTLIEDFFWPDGVNAVGGNQIREVDLTSPVVIPSKGIVTFRVREEFGSDGRITWLATDAPDVGSNDPTTMWIGNGLVTDGLGVCTGGARDGQWCNRQSPADPNVGCPGGTCDDVPDVLAFELIGEEAPSPEGACCNAETGICSIQTPWDCKAGGNTFPGVASCNVCSGNPFVTCNADADCSICLGGDNDGQLCSSDIECPNGTCDVTGTCLTVPPACTLNACCDPTNGSCTTAQGGLCSVSGTSCDNDAQCPTGETCEPQCPAGTIALGFGTDCEPNCCQNPEPSGGDFCGTAPVHQIQVPPPGSPPETFTFNGDNSLATFGEFAESCPEGDENCCESVLFDPNGTILDRGWWEVFETDACADVRIDLCCSDPVKRPAWGFGVWQGCTCAGATGTQIVDPPVGNGTDDGERGGPFCDTDDNFWFTIKNLPRGKYSYPIFSAPEGNPGPYTIHITAQACEVAACCSALCEGGTRDGQVCNPNPLGVTDCPFGRCVNGVCSGGPLHGMACDFCPGGGTCDANTGNCVGGDRDGQPCIVDQCGGGTCTRETCPGGGTCDTMTGNCVGGTLDGQPCVLGCEVTTQVACDYAGGYWHGKVNTGLSENIVSCGSGTQQDPFLCATGSCCQGPGDCVDDFQGLPIDKQLCEDTLNGQFIGGAACTNDLFPCPACSIGDPGERSSNCQDSGTGTFVLLSDLDVGDNEGFIRAEDFISTGTGTITQVCVQGSWIGVSDGGSGRTDCACQGDNQQDCIPKTDDKFTVNVYNDNGGIPGTLFASRSGSQVTMVRALDTQFANFDVWDISLTLDPPITGLVPGQTYFLEIFDNTDRPFGAQQPGDDFCSWFWAESNGSPANDQYSMQRLGPVYTRSSVSTFDITFCIDDPLGAPQAPVGACCRCDFLGCNEVPFAECTDLSIPGGGAGDIWRPGEACPDNGGPACPTTTPFGDDCATQRLELCDEQTAAAGNCPSGSLPPPVAIDTRCATTDGPDPEVTEGGDALFQSDLWFEYRTTCTGRVLVSLCDATTFDALIGLYWDPTNPTVCPCPGDPNFTRLGTVHDGGCSVGFIGAVADQLVQGMPVGTCLTVRVGGFGDPNANPPAPGETGIGNLSVSCVESACFISSAPEVEQLSGTDLSMPRYLPIRAGDPGRNQAIRVTLTSLFPPFDAWNGTRMWVQQPQVFCENSGRDVPPCPSVPFQPESTFVGATLGCDPFFMDWNGVCTAGACVGGVKEGSACSADADCRGTVYVFHEAVVPSSTYDVQVVDDSCSLTLEDSFSPAVTATTSKWGDVTGDCASFPCTVPDGDVGVTIDVTAILSKFKNSPTAVSPKKPRADLDPLVPDHLTNISDVTFTLDAFRGTLYNEVGFVPADPGPQPCISMSSGSQ